jgi:hypothetical protein
MNSTNMHVVTPEFLVGAPANLNQTQWMYEWRREQTLTGLDRKHNTNRKILRQKIDGDRLFDVQTACNDHDCSSIQEYGMNKRYKRRMNPSDCLTAYSTIYGNRSHVIFVSKFDYLWNSSTSVPHFARNGSGIIVGEDLSNALYPIKNSLLFSKLVEDEMLVGFSRVEYDWLCGTTNSFDCGPPYICEYRINRLTNLQVVDQTCGLMILLLSKTGTYWVGRSTSVLSKKLLWKTSAQ